MHRHFVCTLSTCCPSLLIIQEGLTTIRDLNSYISIILSMGLRKPLTAIGISRNRFLVARKIRNKELCVVDVIQYIVGIKTVKMYGKSLSLLLLYMMKLSEASEPPTPYYGSNTEPVATDAANHGDCSVDSVPAVSPSQYNSLTSDVRKIYNLSWWLHDQSIKYYNNKVRASCYNYTCMGLE